MSVEVGKKRSRDFSGDVGGGSGAGEEEAKRMKRSTGLVVFVGNLPFSADREVVLSHFKTCEPVEFRLLTKKGTGRSKGAGFLELPDPKALQKALLLHHSTVKGTDGAVRKINVELSAGGGGSASSRRRKIENKNKKLRKQRKKLFEKVAAAGEEGGGEGEGEGGGEKKEKKAGKREKREKKEGRKEKGEREKGEGKKGGEGGKKMPWQKGGSFRVG